MLLTRSNVGLVQNSRANNVRANNVRFLKYTFMKKAHHLIICIANHDNSLMSHHLIICIANHDNS